MTHGLYHHKYPNQPLRLYIKYDYSVSTAETKASRSWSYGSGCASSDYCYWLSGTGSEDNKTAFLPCASLCESSTSLSEYTCKGSVDMRMVSLSYARGCGSLGWWYISWHKGSTDSSVAWCCRSAQQEVLPKVGCGSPAPPVGGTPVLVTWITRLRHFFPRSLTLLRFQSSFSSVGFLKLMLGSFYEFRSVRGSANTNETERILLAGRRKVWVMSNHINQHTINWYFLLVSGKYQAIRQMSERHFKTKYNITHHSMQISTK